MPMYRAKVTCFVDNGLREEGTQFEYNGPRNTNIELVGGKSEEADSVPKARGKAKTDDAVTA
jgi:hypothetical protein